jgi:hypothetical protein
VVALAKLAQHVELDVLCRHAPRDVLSTAMLLQMQKSTLCVRATCLMFGLRPLIHILMTASLSSMISSRACECMVLMLGGT